MILQTEFKCSEDKRAKQREYDEKHKEERAAYNTQYYDEHREEISEHRKKQYRKHAKAFQQEARDRRLKAKEDDPNYYKKKYHKERSKRLSHEQLRRFSWKMWVVDLLGGVCSVCGDSFCLAAYDVHHTDPSLKDGAFSDLYAYSIAKPDNWIRIKQEIDKGCILVCKNCHAAIHWAWIEENITPKEREANNGNQREDREDPERRRRGAQNRERGRCRSS